MKHINIILLLITFLILFSNSLSFATVYTFTTTGLNDMDHNYWYKWGISWNYPSQTEVITKVSLKLNGIYNWITEPNWLYIHLLDNAPNGVTVGGKDKQKPTDAFASIANSPHLVTYINIPASPPQYYTYEFNTSQINKLIEFLTLGTSINKFGLGFDPDCHFYSSSISLIIETSALPPPIPEPSSFLLFFTGLGGIAFSIRKSFKQV